MLKSCRNISKIWSDSAQVRFKMHKVAGLPRSILLDQVRAMLLCRHLQ